MAYEIAPEGTSRITLCARSAQASRAPFGGCLVMYQLGIRSNLLLQLRAQLIKYHL